MCVAEGKDGIYNKSLFTWSEEKLNLLWGHLGDAAASRAFVAEGLGFHDDGAANWILNKVMWAAVLKEVVTEVTARGSLSQVLQGEKDNHW